MQTLASAMVPPLVGAGWMWMMGGDACIARIHIKLNGHNPTQGDRKGPRPAPPYPRPYKDTYEPMPSSVSL
jgi:hypothetical protein